MSSDIEIIDVDVFHHETQRKSDDSLKRKYQKLKVDVKDLETKNNNLHHANDALRRRMFDKEQCSQRVARLLGFDDIESAEAHITTEDPWISGGQAALADAQARILQLEDELAKHVGTNKEAQLATEETQEQLLDAQAEATRLREGRDVARKVAEQQAAEAYRWRTEVQTTLPAMQALIQELQAKNKPQPEPQNGTNKENISVKRGEASPSSLRNIVNAAPPTADDSASPDLKEVSDSQHYKQQFERIQNQYNALLAYKNKLSARYKEDLLNWRKVKEWIVKDEENSGRRLVRRRKKLEEIGLNPDTPQLEPDNDSAPAKQDEPVDDDPDMTLLDPAGAVETPSHNALIKHREDIPGSAARSPLRAPPQVPLGQAPDMPLSEESLTEQSSSVPPVLTPVAPVSRASPTNQNISLSQESLTQLSSAPPTSPLHERTAAHSQTTKVVKKEHREVREVIVINSSPERLPKQESLEAKLVNNHEGPSRNQVANQRVKTLKSQFTPIHHVGKPEIRTELPPDRKRPRTSQPTSEPPPAQKAKAMSKFSPISKDNARAIRRSSTVLVRDTPPRASAGAVLRHHSSPPDSPHVSRENPDSSPSAVKKGKRKATAMQEEDEDEDGNHSDPFVEGPSLVKATSGSFHTKEENTAYLKALGKKPHKEYMAAYMQYKGRGRYSNTNAPAGKTVNAEFEIDPVKNGGVNHQFEEPVRGKAERKRLEAGDCEECRDYYEAVGPLPPRLQPPLWRSPSSSQSQHRPCRKHNGEPSRDDPPSTPAQAKAIEAHKGEISRHRHNWAPTTTPPGYWRIGFPDTQEVEDINRQANDLHARKFRRVEAEANSKDGRYRKRT